MKRTHTILRDYVTKNPALTTDRRSLDHRAMYALVALLTLMGGIGAVKASETAGPTHMFYPLKLALDDARVNFTKDPEERVFLTTTDAQERLNEVHALTTETGLVEEYQEKKIDLILTDYEQKITHAVRDLRLVSAVNTLKAAHIAMYLDTTLTEQRVMLTKLNDRINNNLKERLDRALKVNLEAEENTVMLRTQ